MNRMNPKYNSKTTKETNTHRKKTNNIIDAHGDLKLPKEKQGLHSPNTSVLIKYKALGKIICQMSYDIL